MTKDQMVQKLEGELQELKAEGEYEALPFNVWNPSSARELDGFIRWAENTHSWGYCRSETCAHNSHDPYIEGGTVFIRCRPIGNRYITPGGAVFTYDTRSRGYHFAPYYRIRKESELESLLREKGYSRMALNALNREWEERVEKLGLSLEADPETYWEKAKGFADEVAKRG